MSQSHFVLMPLTQIRPTEEIRVERVAEVMTLIRRLQAWTHPICVERTVHALLDGHHRLAAAKTLGLARVPVRILDYTEVELTSWRPEIVLDRAEVLARALSGELYPYKTTRHTFQDRPMTPVPLATLIDAAAGETGGPCDVLPRVAALRSGPGELDQSDWPRTCLT